MQEVWEPAEELPVVVLPAVVELQHGLMASRGSNWLVDSMIPLAAVGHEGGFHLQPCNCSEELVRHHRPSERSRNSPRVVTMVHVRTVADATIVSTGWGRLEALRKTFDFPPSSLPGVVEAGWAASKMMRCAGEQNPF